MKTIKIIDLLVKIANGEDVPAYVRYINFVKNKEDIMMICKENIIYKLDQLEIHLNDEVEIIEEDKKIEKIIPTSLKGIDNLDEKIEVAHIDTISAIDKINEIIDYINKEEK